MRVPGSTYRLQLNSDFRLRNILELTDYFVGLGITDLYLSPVLEARPGSTHGYDVTNPERINDEIGTDEEFVELSRALAARGIRILLDIVPNHMSASEENPWWRDVLRHGPASRFAGFFDIDWLGDPTGRGRVVLPLLGRIVTECVEAGELRVMLNEEAPAIAYFDRRFPIDPGTYPLIVEELMPTTSAELREISQAAARLPARDDTQRALERHELGNQLELRFAEALRTIPKEQLDLPPSSVARVLEAQAYALTFWQRGSDLINYRRFFDISDLAGLRMDRADVFEATHQRILPWLDDGTISGVRIDHIDGLRDPEGYLTRLLAQASPAAPPYVIVEKILIGEEPLPGSWKVAGTSGYDFLGMLNGLFIEPEGWRKLGEAYARWGGVTDFVELVYEKKKLALRKLFGGEARTLTRRLAAATDLGNEECFHALVEMTSLLPVYRTYRTENGIQPQDERLIRETAARARTRGAPTLAMNAFEKLLLDPQGDEQHELAMRWQQFTGPVTAKGLEDTAFYNYHRLISVCEVGADPSDPLMSIERFHEHMLKRGARWPHAMNGTSTHDTKRGEDVRARLNVLSEIPDVWIETVDRWLGRGAPDVLDALQLYQTMLGSWPLDGKIDDGYRERIFAFAEKAVREGKRRSSWQEPDTEYEQGIRDFCDALLGDQRFIFELKQIDQSTAFYGALNSLSQTVLKLGAPGVPDLYQGTELWNLCLVDPDNRRPVDYHLRRDARLDQAWSVLREQWTDGRIKMAITKRALMLRQELSELFVRGEYRPIAVTGAHASHVIAFERVLNNDSVTFVAGRFFTKLSKPGAWPDRAAWGDTRLQMTKRPAHEVLTGRSIQSTDLAEICQELPVAILR